MKRIPLTQDKFALVDDEDFEHLNQFKWCVSRDRKTCYALRRKKGTGNSIVSMHRDIMNHPEGKLVDHINKNGLDNRKSNLRVCTKAENLQNHGLRRDSTSGYSGVSYYKGYNKYEAYIGLNGKKVRLGYFVSKHDAARAYNEASKKYHGEFASLNIIQPELKE